MRKTVIFVLALSCFAGLAAAQVPSSGNVFFGYSFQSADSSEFSLSGLGRPNMNGWRASLEGKVLPWVGIVADFTGEYGSQSFTIAPPPGGAITENATGHELDVMFGPRVSVPVGKLTPFGEFLVGVGHVSTALPSTGPSDTSFATAIGGGLDYRIIKPVAWRLQADYVHTQFFGTGQSNFRLATGIVLRF